MRLIRLLKKDLATEMSTWVDRELISVDQARAICRLYAVDYDEIRSRSTAYRVLVVLGFVFIGLALITVIGANWDAIPRAVRMGGLLALTAGTHAFALRHHLADRTSLATGLFVLGNLFYGASIILIAQIYHLGEHMPDGVFWWALGSLPFAVLLCSPWLTLLSGLLALVWLYLEHTTWLLNATFLSLAFPVFLAVELYVLARARANALLFLTFVASLILWFQTVLVTMWMEGRGRGLGWFDGHRSWSEEHVFVGAALFLVAHAAGHWLHARDGAKARDYGALLSIWTLRFALIGMLVMSFELPWEKLITAEWNHQASMWIVVAALAAAALRLGSKTGTLSPPPPAGRARRGDDGRGGRHRRPCGPGQPGGPQRRVSGARQRCPGRGRDLADRPRHGHRGLPLLLPGSRDHPADRVHALRGPHRRLPRRRGPVPGVRRAAPRCGAILEAPAGPGGAGVIRSKIAAGLVAAIAFQLVVLAGMVVNAALPLWTGTEVRVRTVPVDPRSIFRGNYARLGYEFGTLPRNALRRVDGLRLGEVVYVSLEPGDDDEYVFAGASLERPAEGVFLRGRLATIVRPYRVRFGIEAFFAPKEKALELEKDLRNGGAAILMVSNSGRAALKDVIPNPKPDPDRAPDADAGRE